MVLEEEKDFICRLKNRDNEAYIRLYEEIDWKNAKI